MTEKDRIQTIKAAADANPDSQGFTMASSVPSGGYTPPPIDWESVRQETDAEQAKRLRCIQSVLIDYHYDGSEEARLRVIRRYAFENLPLEAPWLKR